MPASFDRRFPAPANADGRTIEITELGPNGRGILFVQPRDLGEDSLSTPVSSPFSANYLLIRKARGLDRLLPTAKMSASGSVQVPSGLLDMLGGSNPKGADIAQNKFPGPMTLCINSRFLHNRGRGRSSTLITRGLRLL